MPHVPFPCQGAKHIIIIVLLMLLILIIMNNNNIRKESHSAVNAIGISISLLILPISWSHRMCACFEIEQDQCFLSLIFLSPPQADDDPGRPLHLVYLWEFACWWRAQERRGEGKPFCRASSVLQTSVFPYTPDIHFFVRVRLLQGFGKRQRMEVEWVNVNRSCWTVVALLLVYQGG